MEITQENRPENMATRDILSLLQWYVESGVDETIDETPLDWFTLSEQPTQKPLPAKSQQLPQLRAATPMVSVEEIARQAEELAASCDSLTALKEAIEGFNGCSLKKTAATTVFSDGNPDSGIMLIGEAPGVEEDRQGKAFAGESGQMLDRMFKAIGLERENDFYLTNILPWRPLGNRIPTAEEIAICLPFIKRHMALFNPKIIILLGGIAANCLLKSNLGIARLRGKWLTYDLGSDVIPVRALFHPAYLLKQPKAKGDAWRDLLEIKAKLEEQSV